MSRLRCCAQPETMLHYPVQADVAAAGRSTTILARRDCDGTAESTLRSSAGWTSGFDRFRSMRSRRSHLKRRALAREPVMSPISNARPNAN